MDLALIARIKLPVKLIRYGFHEREISLQGFLDAISRFLRFPSRKSRMVRNPLASA